MPVGSILEAFNDQSLRDAILSAVDGDTILFTADITLADDLPAIQTSITIDGDGYTLFGNGGQFRGLFIGAWQTGTDTQIPVSVTIHDLEIEDAAATGGDGASGSGGGAGLGGAIFVASMATVTVSDVSLVGNAASGGAGSDLIDYAGGGGGGMGGDGGAAGEYGSAGGGGLGEGAVGGQGATSPGASAPGSDGIATAAAGGGAGGNGGGAGGADGGGGGGGDYSGGLGGGGGGGVGGVDGSNGVGGAGGFGGGGGGGVTAGVGGFGGGGGSGFGGAGGAGGFGGGGGGGGTAGGAGGFGGGGGISSSPNSGGGGAGMGGGIFVMQGGTLIVAGAFSVNGNTVAHGSGGTGAGDGSEFGAGLFLQGNGTVTFNPGASETQAIDDAIADQTGSGGTGANAGSYALVKTGDGTLELNAPNTYSGGTTLNGGTLKFGADNAFGTGTLTVLGSTLTAASFMAIGNAIDLKGNLTVLVDAADTTTLTGGIGDTGGAFGITKTGGGTLSLFGASTYTGDTIVKAGILLAGSAQGFSSASAFKVAAGATLDINGKAVTLGSLADSGAAGGTVTNADTIDEILTIGADNTSTAFSGVIQDGVHSIELKKIGTGTQILSGANTYSLGTTVAGGKLQVDGSITSAVTVASGGTLGGRGSTGAVTVQSGGTLAPGASPGVLSTGNVALAAGATFAIELAGTSPGVGGHDQVKVTGTVNLGGATLDGDVLPGFVPSVGDSFTIIDNDGADAVAGTFAGLAEGDYFVLDQRAMTITYHGGDGNDVVLTATAATIIGTSGPDLVDATHTVAGQALPTDGDDLINGLGGKDTLSGLEGDDTILGGKANDTLHGDEGDDTINGGKGKDKAFGGDGDDAIAGGGGNDRLKGDAGADTLDGGPGKDKLTGGADDDTFVFANPNRPDKVTDMSDGDMIALKKSAFPGIGPKGTLDADAFHVGFTASSPAQKIVYNQHSGWLEWYRHGSHTTDPVAFAKIGKHLDFLDHADFIVI